MIINHASSMATDPRGNFWDIVTKKKSNKHRTPRTCMVGELPPRRALRNRDEGNISSARPSAEFIVAP
jgi:hypothetical protein